MVASLSQALVPKQSANTKRKFNENDDDDQEILDLFRRRNFELLYEKMLNKNLTPAEIKEKLLIMMLENSENYSQLFKPSFKNFFTLVHPKFPPISLNINEINYEMLGRKKDSVRSILFEHCNCQWDPLLFDLFIFPLALKSELYANIELIHNDKNNHRRSCLIDMIHVPPNYPVEYLAFTICERLREFDVDQKVASVNVWGSVFDSALEDFLEKRLECRKKSRMITFSSENSDVTRRQYLAIRRGKLE